MAQVLIVLLLLTCFGLHHHSLACPSSCSCPGSSVLNCSLAGLRALPQNLDSVADLDISHNHLERATLLRRTLPRLRSLRLANNSIMRLSLCIHGRVQGRGCASWAPNLQLLSVERNQLRRLPRGLSALGALEILQLSFNNITTIQLGELDNLRGLRKLHLQHNLISSLHPNAFRHLHQLEVNKHLLK
nr:amphoterin-induced protein 1 [Syngnathus scovelli]